MIENLLEFGRRVFALAQRQIGLTAHVKRIVRALR
jgi:hypothetical protein